MCGLAGIFAYSNGAPPVLETELVRMRDQMLHRGPDGKGLWISPDERVGLAHRRLAIIDLSENGAQPMTSVDGRYQIVFNGEIYNFKELRSELVSKGFHFRGHSDTEVLLALYAQQGEKMCSLLRGMYAFAIWDTFEQSLFLARDPLGIKPLYWHDDGNTIRFSSQVKSLLAGGGIKTESEPAGVVGYWIWGSVPEPFTLYKDLLSLEPGTWLKIVRGGKRATGTFQSLFDVYCGTNTPSSTHSDLRSALLDSVRHHLIADVPVGIFLSAGIDSSTLLALAAECGAPLNSVTLGFKEYQGTSADETVLAEFVAKKYGAKHETIWLTQNDFESQLNHYIASMDQPTLDGLNSYLVSGAAAQAGLKVALSGLGGDELFGGYPSFNQVPKIHQLGSMLAKAPSLAKALRQISSPILRQFTSEKYAGLLEYGATWEGSYLLRRATRMPWEIKDIEGLDSEFINTGLERLAKHYPTDKQLNELGSSFGIVSYLESTQYMRNQLLRDSDWAGMAHSLEIRLPFLDIPLVHYLAQQRRAGNILQKCDIPLTVQPPLPNEITIRPKTGFVIPIQGWANSITQSTDRSRGLRPWQKEVLNLFSSSHS
ncbi:asparagine synthase (glutamine-hydrolyzing) [Polynucleobacter sp. P1-05-14]|uniref:asparagine synthase (glutamine-hydrolyzing) n=1 Tax=Polynucleobacter sp. P1-05-14 TaxID=1819732 RepID=UPI001C0CE2EE|nr:asparagine synthase (glutamine-hydrolyzing) [Polynucleobacter sp. P1-05-14]MBU3548035.1 asparagine synthase (glutamine-hydrolyzing) [Polynucleobacter sp. P1-05-14]